MFVGPNLTIKTPIANEVVDNVVDVSGIGENIQFLTLNDKRIFPFEDGRFRESLLLPEGRNIIKVFAHNRHKKETVVLIPVIVETSVKEKSILLENLEEEN